MLPLKRHPDFQHPFGIADWTGVQARLHVVAPNRQAFAIWCHEHGIAPATPGLILVTPTNCEYVLRGSDRGLRFVETWWPSGGWQGIGKVLQSRDAVHLSEPELTEWLAAAG